MKDPQELSLPACILLAVDLASRANTTALDSLIKLQCRDIPPQLLLRIVLTFLPESTDPTQYCSLVRQIAHGQYPKIAEDAEAYIPTNLPPIDTSEEEAARQVRKIKLRHLRDFSVPASKAAPNNLLTLFLIQRAYWLDREGCPYLLIPLLQDFLADCDYLQEWYATAVLPFISYLEYNSSSSSREKATLDRFSELDGTHGLDDLLTWAGICSEQQPADSGVVRAIFRTVIAPWIYGSSLRRRQRLEWSKLTKSQQHQLATRQKKVLGSPASNACDIDGCEYTFTEELQWHSHINENHVDVMATIQDAEPLVEHEDDSTEDSHSKYWGHLHNWLVATASNDPTISAAVITAWGGPTDVDLGTHDISQRARSADVERAQRMYYCTGLAIIYVLQFGNSREVLDTANRIIHRVGELCDVKVPANSSKDIAEASTAKMLEKMSRIDLQILPARDFPSMLLSLERLLDEAHPLTTPSQGSLLLAQLLLTSGRGLHQLNCDKEMTISNLARMWAHWNASEQSEGLDKILTSLVQRCGSDRQQWIHNLEWLDWLWNWGASSPTNSGIFGQISLSAFRRHCFKALCRAECFNLARTQAVDELGETVVQLAYDIYDQASNGNKSRGSMKKAWSLLSAFRPQVEQSSNQFRRITALMNATHALSFYALSFEEGVPLKPKSLRHKIQDCGDPEPYAKILKKLLEQNTDAYTKLGDLLEIAKNMVQAQARQDQARGASIAKEPKEQTIKLRVVGMSVDAALRADDFETAYSYIVNELSGATSTYSETDSDATSAWRAAFHAGRHPSRVISQDGDAAQIRRLEQRMELLAISLQLAPPGALSDILAAWRRVEEELLAILSREATADDTVERRASDVLPGAFSQKYSLDGGQSHQRKLATGDEAPMGLFDVAKSAAAAFRRSATHRGIGNAQYTGGRQIPANGSRDTEFDQADGRDRAEYPERARKRDAVASAVTEGMVSGIGWVLGARPSKPGGP